MRRLAAVLLLLALAAPAWAWTPPAKAPAAATDTPDVPTLRVGDWWRTDVHAFAQNASLTFDVHSVLTTTVASLDQVVQNGTTYRVYNETLSGTSFANGTFNYQGTPIVIHDLQGPTNGYAWVNRGDLALVRENQSTVLTGFADVLIFVNQPLTVTASSTTMHLPAQEDLDFPLLPPESWDIGIGSWTSGYARFVIPPCCFIFPGVDMTQPIDAADAGTSRGWTNATATVAVTAGTFDTFRLEFVRVGGGSTATDTRWWAPEVKAYARTEVHVVDPNGEAHVWANLTAYSLSPAADWASAILSLNPSSPCGDVTLSGQSSLANSPLEVYVPPTNQFYAGFTDPAGNYVVTFPVPAVSDSTPTTYDVASHGIVLKVTNGPANAYNVTTLTIEAPDVGLAPADVTLSSPRIAGQPVDITATFHEYAGLDFQNCPATVHFAVDGVGISNQTLPSFTALGSQGTTATWPTATPGWHAADVSIDPFPLESPIANNAVSVPFFVEGPDLSLTNIVVDYATFSDTGSYGGRSGTIAENLGNTFTVSFDAENVGTSDAPAGARILVYNTTTEGGAQSDPAIVDLGIANLPPGNVVNVVFTWTAPSVPGTYYFTLGVDPDDVVDEVNEANNTFNVSIATDGPDLAITRVTVVSSATGQVDFLDPYGVGYASPPLTLALGTSATIAVEVMNSGNVDANASYDVAFYNTTGPGGPILGSPFRIGTDPLPNPPGSGGIFTVWWLSPALPGTYHLNVTADYADTVVEITELNNTFRLTFDVSGPDLVPVNLSGPPQAGLGAGVQFTAEASNVGPLVADIFAYEWVLDGTTVIASNTTAGPLPAGTSTNLDAASWITSIPGMHSVCLSLDVMGSINELNESNNAGCLDLQVVGPPETTIGFLGPHHTSGNAVVIAPSTEIVFNATDYSGTGILGTWYPADAGAPTRYVPPLTLAAEGSHDLTFNSTDNLGNLESSNFQEVLVDGSGPALTVTMTNATRRTDLLLTATDQGSASSVREVRYRLDNGTWVVVAGASAAVTVTAVGPHSLQVETEDILGNVATYGPYAFTIAAPPVGPPGDGVDNDGDGRIDEETQNGLDDDGDGLIDEDVAAAVTPLPWWIAAAVLLAVMLVLVLLLLLRRRRKPPTEEGEREGEIGNPPEPEQTEEKPEPSETRSDIVPEKPR